MGGLEPVNKITGQRKGLFTEVTFSCKQITIQRNCEKFVKEIAQVSSALCSLSLMSP